MIRAAIFDLDGTLLNTISDIAAAMNRALRLNGLPEHEERAYCRMVGNGVFKLVERAIGGNTDKSDAVYQDYQSYYSRHAMDQTRPFEGIREMLTALEAYGIRLCVFSNKPHVDVVNVIRHYFPEVPFEVVRGQMPDVPPKPDPAGALAVAAKIGVKPEEFLYLGDMRPDTLCAKNAGMHGVGVTWGFGDRDTLGDAEFIIDSPMQVMELL